MKKMKYGSKKGSGNTARERLRDAQEKLRQMVLDGLRNGKPMWSMPWIALSCCQKSYATSKCYHGSNAFLLAILAHARGYTDNRWITFNEMVKTGHHFVWDARGAGVPVYHYHFREVDVLQPDGSTLKEDKFCGVSEYYVFNVSLTDIPPEAAPVRTFTADEIGEQMLSVSPVEIVYGGSESFYRPSVDKIYLPEKEMFKSTLGFYGTAFHEMVHATGAKKRLDRELGGGFGTPKYAAEELVAEVGSVLLSALLNIQLDQKEETNSCAYLLNWLESCELKDFTDALTRAEKAADWLYGRYTDVYGEDCGVTVNVLKYGTTGLHTGLALLPIHELAV